MLYKQVCNKHNYVSAYFNNSELKYALQQIWTALLQKFIAKGVKDLFPKQLEASVSANIGHFEYKMWSLM